MQLLFSRSVVSSSLPPPPGSSVHEISQARTLESVTIHSLLQQIFLTQGSNQCLLHWQAVSLPLRHQGSPWDSSRKLSLGKMLETCHQQQESNQLLPNHMVFLLSPSTSHSNLELRNKTRFGIFLKQTCPLPPSSPTSQLPASLRVGLPSFPLALCQPPKPLHFLSDPGMQREAKP